MGVNQSIGWIDDRWFITGSSCNTKDVDPSAGLRVAFMRAPYANARLKSLDYSAPDTAAVVRLVASEADLDAD